MKSQLVEYMFHFTTQHWLWMGLFTELCNCVAKFLQPEFWFARIKSPCFNWIFCNSLFPSNIEDNQAICRWEKCAALEIQRFSSLAPHSHGHQWGWQESCSTSGWQTMRCQKCISVLLLIVQSLLFSLISPPTLTNMNKELSFLLSSDIPLIHVRPSQGFKSENVYHLGNLECP